MLSVISSKINFVGIFVLGSCSFKWLEQKKIIFKNILSHEDIITNKLKKNAS